MVRFRRPNQPYVDPLTPEGRGIINEAWLALLKAWDASAATPLEYFEAEAKFRRVLEDVKQHHSR